MSPYKVFAQRIGVIGVTTLAISLSSILLLPILTKTLPIQDYGIWVQTTVITGLMPMVISLGLPNAMMRFLAAAKSKEEISEGFYSIMLVLVCVTAIASLLFFLLATPIADTLLNHNMQVASLLPLLVFFTSTNAFLLFYFRTFQQVKRFSTFQLFQAYLSLVLIVTALYAGFGLVGTIVGMLIAQIIVLLVMAFFIVREIGFIYPKFRNMREYFAFGLPAAPVGLTSWIVDSSDRFIINIFLGTTFVGYYSPGYTLGNAVLLSSAPTNTLLPAALPKHYDENEKHHVHTLLTYSLKYTLFIAIPAVFGLTLLSKPLLTVLATPEIAQQGFMITPLVAIGGLLLVVSQIVGQTLVLEKKTRVLGTVWTAAALVNLALNFVLVPYYGIVGAAATTLAAYAIMFVFTLFYSRKGFQFGLNVKFIAKSLFASVVFSLVLIEWNPVGVVSVSASVFSCSLIYAGIVFALRGFSQDEITLFLSLFERS
jgi:O-antigen/teichoic acid export membrane protein